MPPTAGSWVPGFLRGNLLAARRHEASPPLRLGVFAREKNGVPLRECHVPPFPATRAALRGILLKQCCRPWRGCYLGGGADLFVEEFWREVRTVFPRQGVVGHVEGLEYLRITQGTEDRAFELGGEVDLAGGAVIEAEPHDVVLDVSGFGYA